MKEKMSYEKVDSCIVEFTSIVEDINHTLEQVKQVSNTINQKSLWQGRAADFYANRLTNFVNSIESVDVELRKCISVLQKTKENYQQLDKKIMSTMDDSFYIE